MIRTLFIVLVAALSYGTVCAAGTSQTFTVSGRIDGLQKGDTLRFERVIHPGWTLEQAFDVIVKKPGTFSYKGTQEHDQQYMMTYLPKVGRARACDQRGLVFIATAGDRIAISGTADQIYYSALSGGIYDELLLRELLAVEDSVGMIRGNLIYQMDQFQATGDKTKADSCGRAFNLFYENNPGFERVRALRKAYKAAHPQGTLNLLVEAVPSLSYTPTDEARATYEKFSPELRNSYYGQLYAKLVNNMERLAKGKPTPDFSLTTVDGRTVTKEDFKGNYLLIYHWGMCPGSIAIDGDVQGLYNEYKDKGFKVLGLTESIGTISKIYEALPADKPTPGSGVADIRPVLGGMVAHPWIEVELETDRPENKAIMESYAIQGWPFFVLVGPDGTILARDFHPAFNEAVKTLNRELGGEKQE